MLTIFEAFHNALQRPSNVTDDQTSETLFETRLYPPSDKVAFAISFAVTENNKL